MSQSWENDEFAWALTLQWNDSRGLVTASHVGTTNPLPGDNRYRMTERLISDIKFKVGAPDSAVVLFVSLERNEL